MSSLKNRGKLAMNDTLEQPRPRDDVIQELRRVAWRGATVRELYQVILNKLGPQDTFVISVLWYFCKAFFIPLRAALPIREWMGSNNDAEIDAEILPAIENERAKWSQQIEEPVGTQK
jgi:hypothetical protein